MTVSALTIPSPLIFWTIEDSRLREDSQTNKAPRKAQSDKIELIVAATPNIFGQGILLDAGVLYCSPWISQA